MSIPSKIELEEMIRITNEVAWKSSLSKFEIDKWVKQFNGSCFDDIEYEHCLALLLLNSFVYYNIDEVRYLCRYSYKKYIHKMLKSEKDVKSESINTISKKIVDNTIFLPVGNPSESGTNLLYYYRQENDLPKDKFIMDNMLGNSKCEYVVLIDDVSLSGTQIVNYIKRNMSLFKEKRVFFTPLILSSTSRKYIEEELNENNGLDVCVLPGIILDDREKVLSSKSYLFRDDIDLANDTLEFIKHYSSIYEVRDPLGYKNSQFAFGFFYNIPNNTLPIFWANTDKFKGIFKRNVKLNECRSYKGVNYYDECKFI